MTNRIRLVTGILIWLVVIGWFGGKLARRFAGNDDAIGRQLARFVVQPRSKWSLLFADEYITRIGDPVFWRNDDGRLVQVGFIRQTESPDSQNHDVVATKWASATFFSNAPPLDNNSYLKLYETPQSMSWVAQALLPPERRQEISEFILTVLRDNNSLFVDELRPVFLQALADTGMVVREKLAQSIASHASDWDALGQRFRREIIEQELVPLVNREIWPVVEEELAPVIQQIGEEVWNQASVWRFGWRAIYDSLPFPRQNLAGQEFSRFVEQIALPTIRARIPELMAAQQRVLNRVADKPEVQQFVAATFTKMANDSELQALIGRIIRESVLDNRDFHLELDKIWNSPAIRRALRYSDARLGRDVEAIGEMIFGSPIGGVTPEFARILRHKILLKDMRWYVLTDRNQDPSPVVAAMDVRQPNTMAVVFDNTTDDNPFFIEARSRK